MGHLQLTPIDGQEVGEITSIPDEELAEIDHDEIKFQITVLEEKLTQMKPNMAAIAEYRKKVKLVLKKMYSLLCCCKFSVLLFRDVVIHFSLKQYILQYWICWTILITIHFKRLGAALFYKTKPHMHDSK